MFEQNVTQGPGSGSFTTHTFEILTMLLVALLLGLWLGWLLWNRYKQAADKLRLDNQSLIVTLNAANAELSAVKVKLSDSEAANISLRSQADKLSEENRIFRDQLNETGDDLAETQQRNRQLETELGLSYTPETPAAEAIPLEINEIPVKSEEAPAADAPEQPAATVVTIETPDTQTTVVVEAKQHEAEVHVAAPPLEEKPKEEIVLAAAADTKDDLTVIEGIGPKIQELLYQYGIYSYRQLAETDVARLKEILAAAGPQLAMHDPGTWPSQANLAANDQWENLKSIQGFLKGGKKPV